MEIFIMRMEADLKERLRQYAATQHMTMSQAARGILFGALDPSLESTRDEIHRAWLANKNIVPNAPQYPGGEAGGLSRMWAQRGAAETIPAADRGPWGMTGAEAAQFLARIAEQETFSAPTTVTVDTNPDLSAREAPEHDYACAVLHRDRQGNKIPCPDRGNCA